MIDAKQMGMNEEYYCFSLIWSVFFIIFSAKLFDKSTAKFEPLCEYGTW